MNYLALKILVNIKLSHVSCAAYLQIYKCPDKDYI